MVIRLEKFGTTLLSRPSGKEAFLVLSQLLMDLKENEIVEVDFEGVLTLAPGWADEFLTPLLNQLNDKLILLPSDNPSVHATLKILQEANKRSFKIKS